MKSRFSLQRILELRERKEQAMAAKLGEARTAAAEVREIEAAIETLRRNGTSRDDGVAGTATTVGQLQNAANAFQRLDQKLDEVRIAIRQADAKVNASLAEFGVATRERQVLDRLKDRIREAARQKAADVDRKAMDAIALTRFARRQSPTNGSVE